MSGVTFSDVLKAAERINEAKIPPTVRPEEYIWMRDPNLRGKSDMILWERKGGRLVKSEYQPIPWRRKK